MVNALRYADDEAVVSTSQPGLKRLISNLSKLTKEFGTKITVKKTKVMCIPRRKATKIKILVDGPRVEEVDEFKYLTSVVTSDGYCKNTRSRIAMGKKPFVDKTELFCGCLDLDL